MTNHKFRCLDCKINFSIESEETDINKATKEIPARCPKCMKVWGEKGSRIELQLDVPSMADSIEVKRKRNREASRQAKADADAYARTVQREDMVAVRDPEGRRPSELVPRQLVETIKESIEQINS